MESDNSVTLPRRATAGSAGYDFYAPNRILVQAGLWTEIDTGVRLSDNENVTIMTDEGKKTVSNWFMLCLPRSGLSNRYGMSLVNTAGVIDQDYRQNIRAKVTADFTFVLEKGERFMQGIIIPYGTFEDEESPTEKRMGGFGSTGRQ